MALGEDEAEVEVSADAKARSCGRWNCGEQELLPQGPEPQQPPHLEVEGALVWRTEADPGCTSGAFLSQAHIASRDPTADGSKPAFSGPLPASMGPGDLSHSMRSQVEETELSASQNMLQSGDVLRTAAVGSRQDAGIQDDRSPVESPQLLCLSQQPHISGFPLLSQRKSTVSPGAPQLASKNISASMGSSLLDHQEKVEPQSGSFAKISSLELVVPQGARSVVGPGPQLPWSSQPMASGGDVTGLGRRQLSFQAEYWACVLPDSLPPSPDRHSPLWNPNKEYEDLLDYTYPLRPGPQLPKQSESHVMTDPVMQDSGVDLDSVSVSPASTLKSPTNVSPNCSSAEVPALPFSGAREPCLKRWPLGVPQKQGGIGLASWSQLASTPKAPGTDNVPWESREAALRGAQDYLPMDRHLKVGSPQLRTRERGLPLPRPEREKRASQSVWHPACVKPGWKSEEEMDSDDEYLALPTRLTQVSSLVSYLGAVPTFVNLPTVTAEGQSTLGLSVRDGPASPTVDSTQKQHSSNATFQGPDRQNPCFPHSIHPEDSTGESSLVSSQALGVPSGLLKTHPSLPAVSDRWPFSEADAGEKLPRKAGEQEEASLVQCVQTFCCQLEELIRWLYDVTDVADLGSPPRSSLTSLKSSLQLYRQFKKDVDEHQSLTESVLEKGEILLQCLLDNTPVLKDVLGRIAKQSDELESHADRLYDSILASLDMLAGCTLIPDKRPTAAKEHPCERLPFTGEKSGTGAPAKVTVNTALCRESKDESQPGLYTKTV